MTTAMRMAEVIPFPKNPHGSFSEAAYSDDILDQIFADPRLDQRIQERIEAQLLTVMYRVQLGDLKSVDDPFDDIYLSELQPDRFNKNSTINIQRFRNIKDVSDTIAFSDEWED